MNEVTGFCKYCRKGFKIIPYTGRCEDRIRLTDYIIGSYYYAHLCCLKALRIKVISVDSLKGDSLLGMVNQYKKHVCPSFFRKIFNRLRYGANYE